MGVSVNNILDVLSLDKWNSAMELPEHAGSYVFLYNLDKTSGKLHVFVGVNNPLNSEFLEFPLIKLPGGGVEKGETPHDAAKREFMEETGCEIDLGGADVRVLRVNMEYESRVSVIYILPKSSEELRRIAGNCFVNRIGGSGSKTGEFSSCGVLSLSLGRLKRHKWGFEAVFSVEIVTDREREKIHMANYHMIKFAQRVVLAFLRNMKFV